jgi:hypothetical protein
MSGANDTKQNSDGVILQFWDTDTDATSTLTFLKSTISEQPSWQSIKSHSLGLQAVLEKFEFFPIKCKIQRAANTYKKSRESFEALQQIEGNKINTTKSKVNVSQNALSLNGVSVFLQNKLARKFADYCLFVSLVFLN